MYTNSQFRAFFGGPDRPPRALRDLLYSHIAAVPAGGEIAWATYYFRDQALAQALLQAGRRGVNLRLTLEANPRSAQANRSVIETLRSTGGLRAVKHPWPDNLLWKKPRLHLKLYYFSHPEPHVLLGTFNPSGNRPEDPQVIAEIGDQDRGHNHLVEITGGNTSTVFTAFRTGPGSVCCRATTECSRREIPASIFFPACGALFCGANWKPCRRAHNCAWRSPI